MGVQIIGGKALAATFKALDVAMRTDIAGDVVQVMGEKGAEVASELAPKDKHILEESIECGDVEQSAGGPHVDVGPTREVFYARFQELGTSKMSANPFLRPALDDPRVRAAGQAELAKRIAGLGT